MHSHKPGPLGSQRKLLPLPYTPVCTGTKSTFAIERAHTQCMQKQGRGPSCMCAPLPCLTISGHGGQTCSPQRYSQTTCYQHVCATYCMQGLHFSCDDTSIFQPINPKPPLILNISLGCFLSTTDLSRLFLRGVIDNLMRPSKLASSP